MSDTWDLDMWVARRYEFDRSPLWESVLRSYVEMEYRESDLENDEWCVRALDKLLEADLADRGIT